MKVVVALHDYLPVHAGGAEIHAHQLARELVRRGHDVTAVFAERDLDSAEGVVRRGELDGVKTVEVVHQREYADVGETWEQPLPLARLRELLDELAPDVAHFHHLSVWGAGALPAAREAGARVVLTLHDYHPICDAAVLLSRAGEPCVDGPRGACDDCLRRHPVLRERWDGSEPDAVYGHAARERLARYREALGAAHAVIAPSRFLADVFREAELVADPIVLKYGYPGVRRPPRAAPAVPLRVGFVGGLYASKGAHVLVEAFRHLDGVAAELALHGHLDWFPDYTGGLRAGAEGLPVRFEGGFAPDDVDRVLAGIDVLCVPSIWVENLPLTIQEAFRNGIPVIATDLGGMAESVADGVSGLTFPRGDARALAACIRRLAEDPALYAQLARGRPEVPTLESVVDRLEEVYSAP